LTLKPAGHEGNTGNRIARQTVIAGVSSREGAMLLASFEATGCQSGNFQECKGYENMGKTASRYTH